MRGTSSRAEEQTPRAPHGPTADEGLRQIDLFKPSARFVKLERPCLPGRGIRVLDAEQVRVALEAFDDACARGRFLKFTLATAAANRMCAALLAVSQQRHRSSGVQLRRRAERGDAIAAEVVACMEGVQRFAFFDDLKAAMARDGRGIEACIQRGAYRTVLAYLLTERGLGYAAIPTGLVQFHRDASGGRTAFEGHLIEAAHCVRDRDGVCRLHFNVAAHHRSQFEQLLERVRPQYERRYAARFDVGFSTPASPPDAAGGGSPIAALDALQADLLFINDVANVVADHRFALALYWKRVLGGHLVRTQQTIFHHLMGLRSGPSPPTAICDALDFVRHALSVEVPVQVVAAGPEALRSFLVTKLDRPLRICGMVRSDDVTDSCPFWVKGRDGTPTLQIIDAVQVDADAPDQQAMLRAASYANPVALVCGVRNWRGDPFDLRQYVDTALSTPPARSGMTRRIREHPGLWNATMADWNTIFVEVPAATSRLVTSIKDLLP